MRSTILQILKKNSMKPGVLAKTLRISRQALHSHLRVLIKEKQIKKIGEGPHVVYSIVSNEMTRIQEDYLFCRKNLLPQYLDQFSDVIERYTGKHQQIKKNVAAQKIDLQFLLDSSAVYSSNIEGNSLDLSSFLNSRMAPKKHRPKEVEEIEDLVLAYEFARKHDLNEKNFLIIHKILSKEFVSLSRQGIYRQEPVGVFSSSGLEYMAVESHLVKQEMHELFEIVTALLNKKSVPAEKFFWANWFHLMIALIHPFSDGNGRTARLCEKWFLAQALGNNMFVLQNEELYWKYLKQYYASLKLGANYWEVDMKKAKPFFSLLPKNI